MTNVVVEYVQAELLRNGKTYNVRLKLTIKELMANESSVPVARAIATVELVPTNGLEDGAYTLRYIFDGKREESPVRVQYGSLMAG